MSAEFYSLCDATLSDPLGIRSKVKTDHGMTMVIDKGLGMRQFEDVVETSGNYIDFIKLGFGTVALYPSHILQSKIFIAAKYKINIYPGGTFFEVAFHKGKLKEYFQSMKQIGFTRVEISDGTVFLSKEARLNSIALAKEYGFRVITECGKKLAGSRVSLEELTETIETDLGAGADYIIVEGRENGEDVGIYDEHGNVADDFPHLVNALKKYSNQVIWEAPQKKQQVELINWFGANVHLGNIKPDEVFSVESLRRGLRSDTFFLEVSEEFTE